MDQTDKPIVNPRSISGLTRVRLACSSCRQSKKKCDGARPTCNLCLKQGLICRYSERHRGAKNNSGLDQTTGSKTPPITPKLPAVDRKHYPGMTFVQNLSSSINTSSATEHNVGVFAFNLGLRLEPQEKCTSLPDLSVYRSLMSTFFQTWHTVHSFLKVEPFMQMIDARMQTGQLGELEVVLHGICGLAALFLRQDERPYIEAARAILFNNMEQEDCNVERLIGWFLRTHYFTIAKGPQATWMASITTSSLMDTAELWKSDNNYSWVDIDLLFWLIRLQNLLISKEFGREVAHLRGFRPMPQTQDMSESLLGLFRISDQLYRSDPGSVEDLSRTLIEVQNFQSSKPRVMLSRTILAFAVFREIRATHASEEQVQIVLSLGNDGLKAIWTVLEDPQPWAHLIYLPFQFLCIALSINSADSLAAVPTIINCLQAVVNVYSTEATNYVLNHAYLLVRAITMRKVGEFAILNGSLPGGFQLGYDMSLDLTTDVQQFQDITYKALGAVTSEGMPMETVSGFIDHFK